MPKPLQYPPKEEGPGESVPIPAQLSDIEAYLREETERAGRTINPDEATKRNREERRRRLEEDKDIGEALKQT